MGNTPSRSPQIRTLLRTMVFLFALAGRIYAEVPPAATRGFDAYTASLDATFARQHSANRSYATSTDAPDAESRLQRGEVLLQQVAVPPGIAPGALLHHWRATAFAPGATPAHFARLMRNFNTWPQHFAPDVVQASALSGGGDHWQMRMRVRQHHVITVVLDGTYAIDFTEVDAHTGYSISRSTRIDEVASAGTPAEHALAPGDEHGFLWRQNTYWTYEQRDGGLYLQVESVSLTRPVPRGFGWVVGPYIESIPRESLQFTLRSARAALRK